MTATTRRLLVFLGLVVALVGIAAGPAGAHRDDESYLYLDVGSTELGGRVELTYPDVRTVFGLQISGSEEEVRAELESNLGLLQAYSEEETTIGAGGTEWALSFADYDVLFDGDVGPDGTGYVILPFDVDMPLDEVPQVLDVTFTPFLDEISGRNNIVLVGNDWQRGVFDEESNELLIVDSGSPSGSIDLGDPSQWRNFEASIDLGLDHIRTGPDHIFFILVLLLPSVLVLGGMTWHPASSFKKSLIRVIIVASMFTIAHSITFTLAGLDFIPLPPSKYVEALIALSIAAAALHNLRPVLGHREWLIAFVFGLFHGMGFAGLVDDLGVDQTTQLVTLLGRNVGIEIGQLVIILITFPGLYLLRRTSAFRPLFVVGSLALAVLSSVWVFERLFEVDAGINDAVDKVLLWPRSFWFCVAFTVVSGLFFAWQRRNGSLLPVGVPETPDDEPDLAERREPVPV